ncbi:MAG: YkgJ family cysteine cluster protein [Zavarzinella sp.]
MNIPELSPEQRTALQQIYTEVAADIAQAGPVCDASGRCCRFKEYGHTLFISHIEAAFLLEDCPPFPAQNDGAGCPFQIEGLCTARSNRPLGCRVYYCDPNYEETGNAITEKYLQKLKQLSDRENLGWGYAPLHYFLNSEAAQSRATTRKEPVSPEVLTRQSLPVIDSPLEETP